MPALKQKKLLKKVAKKDKNKISEVEILIHKYLDRRLELLVPTNKYSPAEIKSLLTMPAKIGLLLCESSNVHGIAYDIKTETLKVVFKGDKEYRYLGISQDTYNKVIANPSIGKAINSIKATNAVVQIPRGYFEPSK